MQIVRAVPHTSVLGILTAVHRLTHPFRYAMHMPPSAAGRGNTRPGPLEPPSSDFFGPYVGPLLRALPPSFHPAVVRACCSDPADVLSCDLRVLEPEASSSSSDHDVDGYSLAGPESESVVASPRYDVGDQQLTELLAAAAPLAGGCFKCAYAWTSCTGDGSGSVEVPDDWYHHGLLLAAGSKDPYGAHTCGDHPAAGCGPEWRLPEGGMTRLRLGIDNLREPKTARWCTALAQLRTLRALVVEVLSRWGPIGCSMRDFTAALQHLPSLTHLCIKYRCLQYKRRSHIRGSGSPPGNDDWLLLEGIGTLTQLQSLDLDCCYNAAASPESGRCAFTARAIAQLTQLSRLTCLRYTGAAIASENTQRLAESIRSLASLRKLYVALLRYRSDLPCSSEPRGSHADQLEARVDHEPGAPPPWPCLPLNLFKTPGLNLLQHLEMIMQSNQSASNRVDICERPITECSACMRKHAPALLARLTALRLGAGLFGCEPEGASVAPLLADMPALQSLHLSSAADATHWMQSNNVWSSRDLLSLAGVLPGIAGLTRLDINSCYASSTAVLAVLTALARPGIPVCEGLRDLDIGHNDIGPQHAAELAGLLRQFHNLERLGIEFLGLTGTGRFGLEGLRVVLRSVATLPRLQVLNAVGNCRAEDKAAAWDLAVGLVHVSDIQL